MATKVAKDKVKVDTFQIQRYGDYIWVTTPYKREVIDEYKKLGGKWQPVSKTWLFDVVTLSSIAALIEMYWGKVRVDVAVLKSTPPLHEEDAKAIAASHKKWRGSVAAPERPKTITTEAKSSPKYTAKLLVDDLLTWLPMLTIEEKEEILKPIFDAL